MGRLPRASLKVFSGSANNNGVFGSCAGGDGRVSNNIEVLQSLPTFEDGFQQELVGNMNLPPMEELQGLIYSLSRDAKYLFQQGIPEWHGLENYYVNGFCSHNGTIWVALSDNIGVPPGTNNQIWKARGGSKGGGGGGGPVGSIIPFCGGTLPEDYLPCNGQTVAKANYPDLYDAIGTMYNTGGESASVFRIPNYNNENVFLQGSKTAGTLKQAGLPNIYGTFGDHSTHSGLINGNMRVIGSAGSAARGGNWFNTGITMNSSRSSPIYGSSSTVQPPTRTVIYLILS